MFLFWKKKELADAFTPYSTLEASIAAGSGAAAFIMPVALTNLPTWVPIVALTGLSFTYSYIKTRRNLAGNIN